MIWELSWVIPLLEICLHLKNTFNSRNKIYLPSKVEEKMNDLLHVDWQVWSQLSKGIISNIGASFKAEWEVLQSFQFRKI